MSTPQTTQRTQTPQTWNAAEYAANGRFVADLAGEVVALLNAQPGERILDLGCGDGALTERIAQASGAHITACDADPSMLQAAAARGLKTVASDMRSLPFHAEFDAVFSNAALHWVTDQPAVLRGIHAALTPGGRFVGEMGGLGNIAAIRTALMAVLPAYGINAEFDAASFYPSVAAYRQLLEAQGFRVETIDLVPRPTLLPTGMDTWLRTFRKGVLATLTEADRNEAVTRTVALLEPILHDPATNTWWGDYVRLRFSAARP